MTLFRPEPFDLDEAVGASGNLSLLDKRLLSYAAKRYSPEQMSSAMGHLLTPAACAQRTREILKSYDWLSIVEHRALILLDMIELKEILLDRVRREGGEVTDVNGNVAYSFGDPRWAQNLTKLLSEMNKLISTESKSVEGERTVIRRSHASVMVRALEVAFRTLLGAIQQQYPEVDELVLRAALEDAIPEAITEVERSVDPEEREEAGF